MILKIKKITESAIIPKKAYSSDAGFDLFISKDLTIKPQSRKLAQTGISVEIEENYAGFIQPKSGLAINKGITVLNTPGLIDSNYRGEIGVILYNSDNKKTVTFKKGDKIAQLVIVKLPQVKTKVVNTLKGTKRGSDGFGSTGK